MSPGFVRHNFRGFGGTEKLAGCKSSAGATPSSAKRARRAYSCCTAAGHGYVATNDRHLAESRWSSIVCTAPNQQGPVGEHRRGLRLAHAVTRGEH
eukprot:scaffold164_cov340-Pinguiococcus_pyrenoidosus.AAC.2